jgi:hypothetical protein
MLNQSTLRRLVSGIAILQNYGQNEIVPMESTAGNLDVRAHNEAFVTTHWSVVLATRQQDSPASTQALAKTLLGLLVSPLRLRPASWTPRAGRSRPDAGTIECPFPRSDALTCHSRGFDLENC